MMPATPMVLLILDGWGVRDTPIHNAIYAAHTPHWDALWKNFPHTTLDSSGESVGLLAGQMGNSEVGHLNIGAGRIVYQDSLRISKAIETGDIAANPVLTHCYQTLRKNGRTLHLMGLLSDGGVHSFDHHLYALIRLAKQHHVGPIQIHAFLDGRDTPPKSADRFLEALESNIATIPDCQIATISGRFFAMDRDKRWERTQLAYECIVDGQSQFTADSAQEALLAAYARGETDEFVTPTGLTGSTPIQAGDAVIFFNFRADRARQLSHALTASHFTEFERKIHLNLSHFVTMTQYATTLPAEVVFPPQSLTNTLGEYLSQHHLRQFRIAETEKYAHVTFFFNGGQELPFPLEERKLIPSPKVKTYDLKPEMSVYEVMDALITAIDSQQYDVLICNIANADMVGHTGNFEAARQAIEAIDINIGKLVTCIQKAKGQLLITADHGNAECMYDEQTAQPHTAHTLEPVPLLYVGSKMVHFVKTGCLADVAPTLLTLMALPIPPQMTGNVLVSCD